MATTKKKKTTPAGPPPCSGTEHWRAPLPLADEEKLTERFSDAVAALPRPIEAAIFDEALALMSTPEGVDAGIVDYDHDLREKLTPGEKRAYTKRYKELEQCREDRLAFCAAASPVLATRPEGRERLVAIAAETTDGEIGERVLNALVNGPGGKGPPPDATILERLGPALAVARTTWQARYAAKGLLLAVPLDRALEIIAPLVEATAPMHLPAGKRTSGIVFALSDDRRWTSHDGWIDLVCSVAREDSVALHALDRGPDDPRVYRAVGAYVEAQAAKGGRFFDEKAWEILVRSGDPAYAPHLARSLWWLRNNAQKTLAFLREHKNPAAAEVLRAWIGEVKGASAVTLSASGGAGSALLAEAEQVLAALGDTAPAPEPVYTKDVDALSLPDDQVSLPPLAEQRADLEARWNKASLDPAMLGGLVRHALTMRCTPEKKLPVGASHTGGLPDLPPSVAWPTAAGYPLSFFAQVRLEDVAPRVPELPLPSAGLLSFFACDFGAKGDDAPSYGETVAVIFTAQPAIANLVPRSPPEPTREQRAAGYRRVRYPLCAVRFEAELQLPDPSHPSVEQLRLGKKAAKAYAAVAEPVSASRHQVGGHPLGWVEDQRPDVHLLFQLASDGPSGVVWGDDDELLIFISEDDLRKRAFDAAFATLTGK